MAIAKMRANPIIPCIMSHNFTYVANPGGVADVAQNLSACLQKTIPSFSEVFPPRDRTTAATFRRFASEVLLEAKNWKRETILFFPNYFALPLPGSKTLDVVLVHDLQFKTYPEFHSTPKRAILEISHRIARRHAAGVVFISQTTEADFIKHYGAPRKYATIFNPIDVRISDPLASPEIEPPYAIANFHSYPHKNVRKVFELFAQLQNVWPELKLVVTGNHRGVENVVSELGIPRSSVIVTGFIEKGRVLRLAGAAEFFVSASLFEGFNMSAAEAAKLHRPLLLSDIPVHRELFTDYAYIVDPHTANLDTDQFREYLCNFSARPKWKLAKLTDPDEVARRYREFFDEIVRAS